MVFLTSLNPEAQIGLANNVRNAVNTTTSASSLFWGVAYAIIPIIAYWFLFEKKGEAGWKAIIPIYSSYLRYKHFYKTSKFWRLFVLAILFFVGLVVLMTGVIISEGENPVTNKTAITIIIGLALMFVTSIWMIVISILYDINICKKYGRGFLFTLGMIFCTPIFIGILAYEVHKGRATEV